MLDSFFQTEGTIYAILHDEHVRLRRLLEEARNTEADEREKRRELLIKITIDLNSHTKAEEIALYSRLRKADETHDVSLEAIEEHRVSERLLAELSKTEIANERWAAKMEVLRESLEHHVREEEKEMYSQAKNVLSDEEAIEIGTKFVTEKKRIMDEMTK